MEPITIIGTGLAGYTLAREFRKLDKEMPLRLITADEGHFYSKPMLSNAFAQNKTPTSLVITEYSKMAQQLNAEILTHSSITQIHPQEHRLETNEQSLTYHKLILALGADPIQVPLAGDAGDKVLFVNNLADYTRFYTDLQSQKNARITIMGAGLIGCEFANDLQPAGYRVTLVDPAPNILGRLVPPAIGLALQQALEQLGVCFHLGTTVSHIAQANNAYQLTLADGKTLETDFILSAIGLRPKTDLAVAAGLETNRGIVVNRELQTNQPDIYALGDCAEVAGLVLPFVMPLMNAARALASTLAGQTTQVQYPAMPVVVKTPACPLVVSPPPIGTTGEWQIEGEGQDIKALFYTPTEQLAGMALAGKKVAEKQNLTKELPNVS